MAGLPSSRVVVVVAAAAFSKGEAGTPSRFLAMRSALSVLS